jgi:hypothetical protein
MAKNQKLKEKLISGKKVNKKAKSKKVEKNSKKTKNKDKTPKKKEVKVKNDKVSSPLKEKVKKVMKSNEKPKKVKKAEKVGFKVSHSDNDKLNEYEELFERKTIAELKSILKQNNQVSSGTKVDLVQRCAQGKLWGALPNCPECFGGKLRFDLKSGEYKCPGYMNDTDFVFCKYRATDGIVRNPWQD